jgi:ribokinase
VDSKSNLYDFKGATVIKPNLKEFFEWAGIVQPKNPDDAITKLHKGLLTSALKELEVDNLIITVGELGCIHVSESSMDMYPALSIKAVDVTGAGDSFIAALAVAMSEGKSIKRSIQFANRVASIAVTKKGTQYVTRNEV